MEDTTAEHINEADITPAIRKPKCTDLYRALKLASEVSGKVHFYSYSVDKLKNGEEVDDYYLNDIMKDLLLAECHLELTRKSFEVAKQQLGLAMQTKLFQNIDND